VRRLRAHYAHLQPSPPNPLGEPKRV
jgi:hypothetical protein